MSDPKINDPSRFVSQPGEMELLTPEALMDRLDRMIAEAKAKAEEQESVMETYDEEIEYFSRLQAEADAEIARLDKLIADLDWEAAEYGREAE